MRETGELESFIDRHRRLFVLTGAGCSAPSGIPDYRDAEGRWKRAQPVPIRPSCRARRPGDATGRAASSAGGDFAPPRPNAAHRALARLERLDKSEILLTQNVDRLHQAAGAVNVIDLHGRLDRVRCMGCGALAQRASSRASSSARNPGWLTLEATDAPDGDADLEAADFSAFDAPACAACGGVLKPDVVFFGESVPRERVERAPRISTRPTPCSSSAHR